MDPITGHVPVLPAEVLDLLAPHAGQVALDCTLGRGGHASLVAGRLGSAGTLVGVDLDEGNLRFAAARLAEETFPGGRPTFIEVHGSFATAPPALAARGLAADLVLADLGFSSTQIDDRSRGLSFSADAPLDMRYDQSRGRDAATLLARLSERELTEMLRILGEEPLAQRIARAIASHRRRAPVATTLQLADLVREAYGPRARKSRLHPATRTFMALRIAVNDELNALSTLLRQVEEAAETVQRGKPAWLRPGARIAVISFHSLEDRLVKQAFVRLVQRGLAVPLTRRPITAGEPELAANPRARSAKLRAVRLPVGGETVPAESAEWMDEVTEIPKRTRRIGSD